MKKARLFFALPVRESDQRAIEAWCKKAQHAEQVLWVPPKNYHVTLAFVGETPRESIEDMIDYAESKIEAGLLPFVWTINHASYFRSGIFYATGYNTPMEMTRLARDLDFFVPLHTKPLNFIPHITLARKAHGIVLPIQELTLEFERIGLYESITTPEGVVYEPLAEWGVAPE